MSELIINDHERRINNLEQNIDKLLLIIDTLTMKEEKKNWEPINEIKVKSGDYIGAGLQQL